MSKRRVDAIVRVSRLAGREGDALHTVEMQKAKVKEWAKANDARIVKWYDESNSVSGGTVDREAFQEAMSRALNGTTDGIVVAKLDRFARTPVAVDEIKRLQAAGKSFVACNENIDTNKASASGNLMLNVMFAMAAWQRDALTEQWAEITHRHVTEFGVHTQEPFGYRKNAKRVLVPDAAEAAVVVEMFERRARGESWAGIARALDEAGVRTRDGKVFMPSGIARMVRNRVYLGEITAGAVRNDHAHDAIVTHALFDAANARRGAGITRTERTDDYLLSGVLRCASCGQTMRGEPARGGRKPRYRCRINHGFGRCEAPVNVMAAEVDEYVTEMFLTEAATLGADGADDTAAIDRAHAALVAAEDALTSWALDPTTEAMRCDHPEVHARAYDARHAAVEAARAAYAEAKAAAGARGALSTNLVAEWPTMSNEDRRAHLSAYYAVIAARGSDGRTREPIGSRVAAWVVGDPTTPTGFGSIEGGRRVAHRSPITVAA